MQEILEKAAISQQNFKQEMNYLGYETKTTFYGDFTIAELVSGVEGVKDTFKRAFDEWKTNIKYFTELVMVLNHKAWEHHEKNNRELSVLYVELYEKADDHLFSSETFTDEQMSYAFSVLD